jgi:hypothetical protein
MKLQKRMPSYMKLAFEALHKKVASKAPAALPAKSVTFAEDTNFESAERTTFQFCRTDQSYVPGKNACPKDHGEWEDTSFMEDHEYQLLHLKVHAVLQVRDECQAAALRTSFDIQMKAGVELLGGTNMQLKDHSLCKQILELLDQELEEEDDYRLLTWWSELMAADSVVIYKYSDGHLELQFLKDIHEEQHVKQYLAELRESIPAGNVGLHRDDVLRILNAEWLDKFSALSV